MLSRARPVLNAGLMRVFGKQLIVSYSGDAVYLFDTDAEAYTPPARQRHRRRSDDGAKTGGEKRRRKGRSSSVGAGSDSEMDEERPQVASAPEDDDDTGPPPPLEALAAVEHLLSTGEPTPTSSDVTIETDDVHTDTESSSSSRSTSPLRPSVRRTEYELDAPLVGPVRLFSGHANEETVKDVNFAFAGSTVVSGSDDGNWFAWDKESGELKGIYQGDESGAHTLSDAWRVVGVLILAGRQSSTCSSRTRGSPSWPSRVRRLFSRPEFRPPYTLISQESTVRSRSSAPPPPPRPRQTSSPRRQRSCGATSHGTTRAGTRHFPRLTCANLHPKRSLSNLRDCRDERSSTSLPGESRLVGLGSVWTWTDGWCGCRLGIGGSAL